MSGAVEEADDKSCSEVDVHMLLIPSGLRMDVLASH